MELYTRAYPGLTMQIAHYFGIPLTVLDHSTLNEKLGILSGTTLGNNELPRVAYFAIGNGGHGTKTGVNSFPLLDNKIHKTTDTGLFNQLPFVLRPIAGDLEEPERALYGLRRIEQHNGNDYVAYYLKRIDRTGLQIKVQNRVVDVNQNTALSDFIPSSDDLSPTPVNLDNTGVNSVTGKYVSASVNLTIGFNAFDAEEFLNVITVIYGNVSYGIISEGALVSGVDRIVSSNDGAGGTISFNEVVCAQIANQIPLLQPVYSQRNGFDIIAEVGGIEPLLNLELVGL